MRPTNITFWKSYRYVSDSYIGWYYMWTDIIGHLLSFVKFEFTNRPLFKRSKLSVNNIAVGQPLGPIYQWISEPSIADGLWRKNLGVDEGLVWW